MLALFTLSSADGVLTMLSVGLGIAYEANPAMRALYDVHPLLFYAVKQATMYACCRFLLVAYVRRPAYVTCVSFACCAVYAAILCLHFYILWVTVL